jgi:hypothetical protein
MTRPEPAERGRLTSIRSILQQRDSEEVEAGSDEQAGSLADILLAIEQKRGALYMRDTSQVLIESWNLRTDRLDRQSPATLELLAKLLQL